MTEKRERVMFMGCIFIIVLALGTLLVDGIFPTAFAGEGYDKILRRWMARGNMTQQEIDAAMKLSSQITISDSLHAILPDTILYISKDFLSGYEFYITDTIWGVKLFPKEENVKSKKSRGP